MTAGTAPVVAPPAHAECSSWAMSLIQLWDQDQILRCLPGVQQLKEPVYTAVVAAKQHSPMA